MLAKWMQEITTSNRTKMTMLKEPVKFWKLWVVEVWRARRNVPVDWRDWGGGWKCTGEEAESWRVLNNRGTITMTTWTMDLTCSAESSMMSREKKRTKNSIMKWRFLLMKVTSSLAVVMLKWSRKVSVGSAARNSDLHQSWPSTPLLNTSLSGCPPPHPRCSSILTTGGSWLSCVDNKSHNLSVTCPQCGRKFVEMNEFNDHVMREHEGLLTWLQYNGFDLNNI